MKTFIKSLLQSGRLELNGIAPMVPSNSRGYFPRRLDAAFGQVDIAFPRRNGPLRSDRAIEVGCAHE